MCHAGLCLTLSDALGGGAGCPAHHLSFYGPTVGFAIVSSCASQHALQEGTCVCAWLLTSVLMLGSMGKAGTGCSMHRALQICSTLCASMSTAAQFMWRAMP